MSVLKVDTITKADGTGSLSVPAESGTVVTTASPSLGRRNIIINGAMQVAQRGTSAASTGWGQQAYRTVDRWQTQFNASTTTGTATQEQITDQSTTIGHPYYTRFTVDTAQTTVDSTARFTLKQVIENSVFNHLNWGTSAAKDLTLSFWVRSNITGTFSTAFRWHDSTGTVSSYTSEYTISTANTWEYKTISIPAPSLSTTAYSEFNVEAAQLRFSLMTGSTQAGTVDAWQTPANTWGSSNQTNLFATSGNTFDITGVQLEVGSVATPFEHRSYGEELALCQRYYQQYDYTAVYQTVLAPTFNISTSDAFGTFFFAVPMRVTPSFSTNGAGNFRLNNNSVDEVCSNVYHQTPTVYGTAIRFVKTTANLLNGGISYVNTQLDNDASLRFDAEL